ncbi:MAG: DUF423 domain-containing protein [Bacteroidota bacterium]
MNKRIIVIASVFGILAVILGAFGAHGLKQMVSAEALDTWHTAVQYQFYHTLAMLFLATFSRFKSRAINAASWFFTAGIMLFSGSLYLISTKELLNIENGSLLGPLTPIGGLFFILGWICLLVATIKNK